MNKKFYVILLFLIFTAIISGCGNNNSSQSNENLQKLASVEVKEYEGKDLSSITDFRENSIKGPQQVDVNTYKLVVNGLVQTPMDYTYDQVLENEKHTKMVTLHCVEGWSVDILWEGILLKDLFDQVNVNDEATTVIFYAADGYTTSLPLETILQKDMIMAFKMNGVVLPPERGFPFQLVAEDKLGYKWAKWINRIELSSDSDYKGYWEKRGYTNDANVKN